MRGMHHSLWISFGTGEHFLALVLTFLASCWFANSWLCHLFTALSTSYFHTVNISSTA